MPHFLIHSSYFSKREKKEKKKELKEIKMKVHKKTLSHLDDVDIEREKQ